MNLLGRFEIFGCPRQMKCGWLSSNMPKAWYTSHIVCFVGLHQSHSCMIKILYLLRMQERCEFLVGRDLYHSKYRHWLGKLTIEHCLMLSFGSRDDELVRHLTLAAKSQYTDRGKQTFVEESAFIEAVIASTKVIFDNENV